LVHKLDGRILTLMLDTDLPDDTALMVGVSRAYFESSDPTEYPIDYFSEKSTVGAWRSPRRVLLDEASWAARLNEQVTRAKAAGIGADPARFATTIDVSFVVPINQTNPRFGAGNSGLRGEAVTVRSASMRIVEAKLQIDYPRPGRF
jgi:hypothetical protein